MGLNSLIILNKFYYPHFVLNKINGQVAPISGFLKAWAGQLE
jgi:hypothetical protein